MNLLFTSKIEDFKLIAPIESSVDLTKLKETLDGLKIKNCQYDYNLTDFNYMSLFSEFEHLSKYEPRLKEIFMKFGNLSSSTYRVLSYEGKYYLEISTSTLGLFDLFIDIYKSHTDSVLNTSLIGDYDLCKDFVLDHAYHILKNVERYYKWMFNNISFKKDFELFNPLFSQLSVEL